MKKRKIKSMGLKSAVAMAMLSAVSIILGKFLAVNAGNVLRFSFENLPILFAGFIFGPAGGAAVGLLADLVGCVLVGYEINPLITLGAVLIGGISGFSFDILRKTKIPLALKILISVFPAHLIGSVVIKTIGLSAFYAMELHILMLWRLLNYAIIGAAEGVILYILLKNKMILGAIASFTGGLSQREKITKKEETVNLNKTDKSTMTYDEALKYIHGISWTFCKPGLERISELCERLGHPEEGLKFVHVAGTNGKGSFCSMLEAVLRGAGYKIGLFTSPYIVEFGERMKFLGENIDKDTLAEITEYVMPIAESMKDKPTEFELITAIGFEYFKRCGAEIVILEAGMGGRLDSTNIIKKPELSVITGVALDHTALLGDTIEKIATEKAGIIKGGCPVLFGGSDYGAYQVIKSHAEAAGSELYSVDYDRLNIISSSLNGTVFSYKENKDMEISLLGLYQPRNASLVLEAVDILRKAGFNIGEEAVRLGLKGAKWPARFEIIKENPLIIFDGAHNPEGIEGAVKSILHYFPGQRVCAVSGVLADKDYGKIAKELSLVVCQAFTMTPDSPRALSADTYAEVLSSFGVSATATGSTEEALRMAIAYARENNVPIVCLGSLYTYIDVINAKSKII